MKIYISIYITIFLTITSCLSSSKCDDNPVRQVTDAIGRNVFLPDTIRSVIALRPGALRLLCYIGVADEIGYIEGNEKTRSVPYILANPQLRELEVIGTGNNYDTELLAASKTSLIVTTYMNRAEADKLQKITRKPVIVLKYGNFGYEIDDLYYSLRLLGVILNREERAESLIDFINTTFDNCRLRSTRSGKSDITVYIGGVAHSGSHGLTSTVPFYPPFRILSVKNSAQPAGKMLTTKVFKNENAFIDSEQLILWNPDYLFLDVTSISIWHNEIRSPLISETLKAVRKGRVYTILPYNWYTINYENLLCNTWFIGKTIFPEAFSEISIEQKCREIYSFFLSTDIYDEMKNLYNPFVKYQ